MSILRPKIRNFYLIFFFQIVNLFPFYCHCLTENRNYFILFQNRFADYCFGIGFHFLASLVSKYKCFRSGLIVLGQGYWFYKLQSRSLSLVDIILPLYFFSRHIFRRFWILMLHFYKNYPRFDRLPQGHFKAQNYGLS